MSYDVYQVELESDVRRVARLGHMFHAEGDLPGEFKSDVFTASWMTLLQGGASVIHAIDSGEKIAGALGAVLYPDPNDGELVASEFFWFVDPGARGVGLRLFRSYETWARSRGAKRIFIAHTMLNAHKLQRFYERQGYRMNDIFYVKEI